MLGMRHVYHVSPFASTPHRSSPGYVHPPPSPWSYEGFRKPENEKSYTIKILTLSHSTIPHRSPTVQVNITKLIDDVQCYQTVRALRWPDGVACPSCESKHVIKRGFNETEPARQRYECHDCTKRFDDLTDTIFAGHHQPLKVWVLCLYFMGLNV